MGLIKKFSANHAILFSVIVTGLTLLVGSLFSWDENPITGLDKLSGDLLITALCTALIFCAGINKTAGFCAKGFFKGILLGLPFFIIGIGGAVIGNIGTDLSALKPAPASYMILFTLNMLFVGINEEISMRALVLNNLLCKYGGTRAGVYKSVAVSACVFGGMHFVNIFFMHPVAVVVQAVNAAAAGVLFAAVFIRSRNIWAAVVLHFSVDWLSLFIGQCFEGGQSVLGVSMTVGQGAALAAMGSLPPLIIAGVLLRKSKTPVWLRQQ